MYALLFLRTKLKFIQHSLSAPIIARISLRFKGAVNKLLPDFWYNKMIITITNWKKYNQRPDVKKCSWFRVEHIVFFHPDFHDFTAEDFCAFFYLLCYASLKNSERFEYDPVAFSKGARIKRADFDAAINKLESLQILNIERNGDVTSTLHDVTSTYRYVQNDTKKDTTDKTDTTEKTHTSNSSSSDSVSNIISIYNEVCLNLPKSIMPKSHTTRYKKISKALKENPDASYWKEVFTKANESRFLTGGSESGWKANIDWIFSRDNHLKIFEGTYSYNQKVKNKSMEISNVNKDMFEAVSKGEL